MGKKTRIILLSMVTVCLCMALVIGATYALFSGQITVNNHLQAGSLEVGLERVGYQTCTMDEDGRLVTNADDTTVDLLEDAEILFQIQNIVPGCWYEADIRVSNQGDVAFDYGVRLLWNEESDATVSELALAAQIQISVQQNDQQKASFMLDQASEVNLGSVFAKGDSQTFTVKASFVSGDANNDAQDAELNFDLQVYATQKTA